MNFEDKMPKYDNQVNDDKFMNTNMNMGMCMPMGNMMGDNMGCCQMCEPIYECPEEKVCHRFICYEVPQE